MRASRTWGRCLILGVQWVILSAPQPLSIPVKKLIRYAGKDFNARIFRDVKDWIRRNRFTGIQGFMYKAEQEDFVEVGDEPLFLRYRLRGETMENGELAETNFVWLAPWFLPNYTHGYLRPIDFAFRQRLRKPIAKSLYSLLETGWYAASGNAYAKSYRDLCQEFSHSPGFSGNVWSRSRLS
jgi:hypothetical protein